MHRLDLTALDTAGHLLVPDALDAARVARLRLAFPAPAPDATGTQHVTIDDATPARDEWRSLADHPLLRAAAAHVLGPEFHVRDVHGRNPLPGHGLQGLHADWPARAAGQPFEVLTALWLLDEFTAANGATRIVPGTHLLPRPVPRDLAQPHARHPDERIVTGPAGAVLLLNGHLWHAGRLNTSAGPRRCVQMVVQRGPLRARDP